ncbi:hypothetical protein ACFPTR_09355 [Aliibacillus thermotolerans]|uniref:Uncharacterized protein n=1 Tax=Aliibacillus thermotolerans TaxID=1834418 RepID=A0ABW0U9Z2_9BACI|nr:hypothetical protein [Aliibacillus thermotolerans]
MDRSCHRFIQKYLWKQAMNGSWHRFDPNTIVKAIHARCMAPIQR